MICSSVTNWLIFVNYVLALFVYFCIYALIRHGILILRNYRRPQVFVAWWLPLVILHTLALGAVTGWHLSLCH